jgi:hypothetical protein
MMMYCGPNFIVSIQFLKIIPLSMSGFSLTSDWFLKHVKEKVSRFYFFASMCNSVSQLGVSHVTEEKVGQNSIHSCAVCDAV